MPKNTRSSYILNNVILQNVSKNKQLNTVALDTHFDTTIHNF